MINDQLPVEEELDLEEDILTSFDYYFNTFFPSNSSPEVDLMKGVLIYAVIDYLSSNRKEHYEDAKNWLFNKEDNCDYIYSFSNVCDTMGMEPKQFQEGLKRLKKSKVKFALDGKRINS